ncbi:cytochrome P450 [Planobispora siamensis]|uniref:cytochrome P450 n=1 Tax=Planobispora siamensis TaxID=936338 RepID=UPI0035E4B32B
MPSSQPSSPPPGHEATGEIAGPGAGGPTGAGDRSTGSRAHGPVRRPPGPRIPVLPALRLLHDPIAYLEAQRRRYGPVFAIRFPGLPPEVFVTTAELAERVYALDAEGGRAGEVRRRFLEPMVGHHSLLTLDHEPWWRHRRLLTPPLHGRAISGYRDDIARIAAEEIETWPLGTPFALRERVQRITLEVILRLVFGIDDARRLARLRVLIPRMLEAAGTVVLMLPPNLRERAASSPLRRVPFLGRFAALRAEVDGILYEEIARRRALTENGTDGGTGTDVLSRLMAARDEDGRPMPDRELRDELITMLQAGHETTATGLAWAFERLTRAPQALARLRRELAAGDDDQYLQAVVKETLRCRPVVWDVSRLVDVPLRLGGYEVPAGWFASPLIALIHRDPEAFPQPDAFRPERFLGPEAARANRAWQPFGGGRRYCVGAQLALLEMRVIIAEVLRRVEPLPADPGRPERQRMQHVTLVPSRRARVVVRARTASPQETPPR